VKITKFGMLALLPFIALYTPGGGYSLWLHLCTPDSAVELQRAPYWYVLCNLPSVIVNVNVNQEFVAWLK